MDVKLVMFRPNGQRKDFPLTRSVSVIGRGENCDLRVPLLSVSRRHCELSVSGNAVKIKDLASSNGTYVNNRRVNEQSLSAGDRIVVGPVVFTVQLDGVPEEIKPVKTRGQKLAEQREAESEEIIDLEADVAAQVGASSGGIPLEGEDEEEIDPIAALEALAAESEEDEEDEDKGKP